MPPTSSLNDLLHDLVVVSRSHIEPEKSRTLLWLCLVVLRVDRFVKFLHQFDVKCKQKVRFFQLTKFYKLSVAFRHGHVKVAH
jgi:hypothetical protein